MEIERSHELFENVELNYWNYYRELEDEFIKIRRYVDFNSLNNNSFSVEFLKLYQAVCSEIDVIGKAMAHIVNPSFKVEDNTNNILKWWYEIQNTYLFVESPFTKNNNTPTPQAYSLNDYKCYLLDNIELIPWSSFKVEKYYDKKNHLRYRPQPGCSTPSWWSDYNKVKHNRTLITDSGSNYSKANFKNVCCAFSALYVLEHSLLDMIGTTDDLQSFMNHSVLFTKKRRNTFNEMELLYNVK